MGVYARQFSYQVYHEVLTGCEISCLRTLNQHSKQLFGHLCKDEDAYADICENLYQS
jgi:hypothetical protein